MDFIALNSPLPFPPHAPTWLQSKWNYPSSLLSSSFSHELLRHTGNAPAIVASAGKHKKKKDDAHSFFPRPNEATGPFPESVLLRERKVEEDGMLMPEFADVEERELFEALNLQLESDMDIDRMRHYEVVYLIHEDYMDEVENVNTKVQEFLKEKKGKIWRLSDWGMRRLAYKIRKAKNAHYMLMNFELETKWINDFKSLLDQDERVIRHLVMKRDKAKTEDCPPPPEFHTLHAGTEEEEEYEEDEDWGDDEEGVIYVGGDDDNDDRVSENLKSNKAKSVRAG